MARIERPPGVPWSRRRLALAGVAGALLGCSVALAGLWAAAGGSSPPPAVPAMAVADIGPGPAAEGPAFAFEGEALVARPATPAAFAGLPPLPAEPPLPPAPDPALLQATDIGRLPVIAADGRMPRQAYARPFDRRDDRARIVLIVTGVGLAEAASRAAIEQLPGAVVLAIDAYAPDADQWARWARRGGHEVIASVLLQSASFPYDDAGPAALRPHAPAADNVRLIEQRLGAVPGAVGVLLSGDSGFGEAGSAIDPVLEVLRTRGLLLVEAARPAGKIPARMTETGEPRVRVDLAIDETLSPAAMDRELATLAALARQHFVAVGLARAHPATLQRLRRWIDGLASDRYVLAPVTAVVTRTETP